MGKEFEDEDLDGFFNDGVDAIAEEVSEEIVESPFDATTEKAVVSGEPKSEVKAVESKNDASLGSAGAFDFGVLASIPGVVVGQTGTTITRFPVERAKFTKGNRALISILSDQVVIAKTHYKEGLGNFFCFGGKCCDRDLARVRYCYPVAVYETNAKGKPISTDMKNEVLVLGQDTYQSILDIVELKGPISQFDLLVNCTDEQYQKISIQEAGLARYKKSANCVREINEFWSVNAKNMLKSVARTITPQEFEAEGAVEATSDDSVNFEDVFS